MAPITTCAVVCQAIHKPISLVAKTDARAAMHMAELNTDHSHYRIVTENCNRTLKLWGSVRGRSDARMHHDPTYGHGSASFEREVRVVWSLENMRRLGKFSGAAPALIQIY